MAVSAGDNLLTRGWGVYKGLGVGLVGAGGG